VTLATAGPRWQAATREMSYILGSSPSQLPYTHPRVHPHLHAVLMRHHMHSWCRYSDALDAALSTGRADVIAAVVDELIIRNGMKAAIAARSAAALVPVVQHVCKYIAHPDHARMCLQVANLIFDLHVDTVLHDDDLSKLVLDLKGRLGAEVKVQQDLQLLQGMIEMLLQCQY
jgi:UTP15 C terminal